MISGHGSTVTAARFWAYLDLGSNTRDAATRSLSWPARRTFLMSIRSFFRRNSVFIVWSIAWSILVIPSALAESNFADQNVIAVSGIVTGNVQKVGFRAMIQKQAIQHNLAGSAKNVNGNSVRFVLQGLEDRIDQALKAIRKGTKKSSNVKVGTSSAPVHSLRLGVPNPGYLSPV